MILRGTWNQLSNAQIGRTPTARVAAVVKYHSGGLRLRAPAVCVVDMCPPNPSRGQASGNARGLTSVWTRTAPPSVLSPQQHQQSHARTDRARRDIPDVRRVAVE